MLWHLDRFALLGCCMFLSFSLPGCQAQHCLLAYPRLPNVNISLFKPMEFPPIITYCCNSSFKLLLEQLLVFEFFVVVVIAFGILCERSWKVSRIGESLQVCHFPGLLHLVSRCIALYHDLPLGYLLFWRLGFSDDFIIVVNWLVVIDAHILKSLSVRQELRTCKQMQIIC
jgi:hypothetical protein